VNYKHVSACLALFVLALPGTGFADDSRRNQPQLIWSEEFNTGTVPDANFWNYDTGATGWGNQELQLYTDLPSNARVENGNLVITARRHEDGEEPFTSARIHTQDKLEFQYGILVARIKLPDLEDGLWPAFWALGSDFSEVGWPDCGELDVMELGHSEAIRDGQVNHRVGSAAHWEHKGEHALYHQSLDSDSDLSKDFHIFRMTWTPEFVRTSVDGEPVWTMDLRKRSCSDCSEFHQPFFVILNLAVGGTYPGKLAPDEITAPFPAEMLVDYVRLYDNGFTEISGSALNRMASD
jgi:beta-glucanase (GH16 family)